MADARTRGRTTVMVDVRLLLLWQLYKFIECAHSAAVAVKSAASADHQLLLLLLPLLLKQ